MKNQDNEQMEMLQWIRTLWNQQCLREKLYLSALKMDQLGPLRKKLAQGHFSSLLFQKELKSLYDYFKCFLTDEELVMPIYSSEQNEGLNDLMQMEGEEGQVAGFFKRTEAALLHSYQNVTNYLEWDYDSQHMLQEHKACIKEFYDSMANRESQLKILGFSVGIGRL